MLFLITAIYSHIPTSPHPHKLLLAVPRINGRVGDRDVTQVDLHGANIVTVVDHVEPATMAQHMRVHAGRAAASLHCSKSLLTVLRAKGVPRSETNSHPPPGYPTCAACAGHSAGTGDSLGQHGPRGQRPSCRSAPAAVATNPSSRSHPQASSVA